MKDGDGRKARPVHVAVLALMVLAAIPGGPFAFLPPIVLLPAILGALVLWGTGAGTPFGTPHPLPPRAGVAIEALAVGAVVAAFLLFKVAGLHPSGTDDNIYFYLAKRLSEGAIPYRDFFFAHPPVHLLVPAAAFGVGGFSIGLAKSIPVTAQMVATVCLYLAARRASRPVALVAVALHLFAYQVLMGSTDMNGENLMTMFLAAGLLAASRGRHGVAGALAGLALGCGLYALAGVAALGLAATSGGRKAAGRFVAGVAGTFGGVCAVFWILGGSAFWDGVIAYHLNKAVRDPDKVPVFAGANPFAWIGAIVRNLAAFVGDRDTGKWLYYHLPETAAAALAAVAMGGRALAAWFRRPARVAGRRERRRGKGTPGSGDGGSGTAGATTGSGRPRAFDLQAGGPWAFARLGLAAGALFIVQWAALAETYDFYLVPMWFFLALPAAVGVGWAWTGVATAGWNRALILPAAGAALLAAHPLAGGALSDSLWPEEGRAMGETVAYEWRAPWAMQALGPVSKALFFHETRTRGIDEPAWRHAMWNKQLTFGAVDDIAAAVRDGSAPDETVTGASTLAPLVALQAGRRMSADEADTNGKRFNTGMLTDLDFARRICADRVRFLVGAARSHFEPSRFEKDPLWSRLFERHREFVDSELVHRRPFPITLYRLKDGATLPDGTPCRAATP